MSEKMRRAKWFAIGAGAVGAIGVLVGAGEVRFGNGPFEINDVILTPSPDGGVHAWRATSRTDYDTGATVTTVEFLGYGSPTEGKVVTYTQRDPAGEAKRITPGSRRPIGKASR